MLFHFQNYTQRGEDNQEEKEIKQGKERKIKKRKEKERKGKQRSSKEEKDQAASVGILAGNRLHV